VPLPGGIANRGKVVRIGNAVHRPQRDTSPTTHALLHHLETVGFDGAPRLLGVDSQNREVLTYIPGTPTLAPYPDWSLTNEVLISVAKLLRAYHQAVANFDTPIQLATSAPAVHDGPPRQPLAENTPLDRCQCFIDLALAETKERVKQVLATALDDWTARAWR
jgi:hypothetical protein